MSHDEIISIDMDAQESELLSELRGLPPLGAFGDLAPIADALGCKPDASAIITAVLFLKGAAEVGASLPAAHVTAQATIAELRAERDRLRGELEAAKEHARIDAIAHDRALRALAATVRGES